MAVSFGLKFSLKIMATVNEMRLKSVDRQNLASWGPRVKKKLVLKENTNTKYAKR